MYATAAFNFNQASNGVLMSEFALMRGIFLLLIFPRLISFGRKSLASKRARNKQPPTERDEGYGTDGTLTPDSLPTDPRQFDSSMGTIPSDEPVKPTRPKEDEEVDPQFDLTFLRWSLVVDGGFTMVAAFATEPWHIYLGMSPRAVWLFCACCPCKPLLTFYLQPHFYFLLAPDPPQPPRESSHPCAPTPSEPML